MIKQRFTLDNWNWDVRVYYAVHGYYVDEIVSRLMDMGISQKKLKKAERLLTSVELNTGLSLREAQKMLLSMYNKDYQDERPYCNNWGLAVIQSNRYGVGAYNTCGSRCYEYDSRVYTIEEDE